MSANVVLIVAIAAITVGELAAATGIILWGPAGRQSELVAMVIGIPGPIITSLLALWRAEKAVAHVQGTTAEPPRREDCG